MQQAHHSASNVVPIRGGDTRSVRYRADITSRVADLLSDVDAFLSTFRMLAAGLEPALDQGRRDDREPDVTGFMTKLRACHRKSSVYAIEATGPRVWRIIEDGEHLLIAPSCKLRALGLCLASFTDGRPPDLRVFVGRRDTPSGPAWILTSGNTEPATIEPATAITALHPAIGSLLPAMTYDRQYSWTSRIADFIAAKDSREQAINKKWRPA